MATEATTQANDTTTQNNQRAPYTPEQQAHIDQLIREAQGRAASDTKAELQRTQSEIANLRTDLEAAKAAAKNATSKTGKDAANADVAALEAQMAEMRNASQSTKQELERLQSALKAKDTEVLTAKQEATNVRKQVAITNAASKVNFVNTEVVSKLTQDSIKYDESKGRFVVLGENGAERMNASYEPMSLDEFYTEFASKNPYLVRGSVKTGTGSTESGRFDVSANGKYEVKQIFGKGSDSKLAMTLYKEDPKEYQRLKGIAKSSGLIA